MSDTSLVFNLVARERVSETLGKVKEKFDAAATGIAAGVAGGLAAGVAQSLDMSAANAKLAAQLGVGPAEAAKLSKVSANVYANAWGDSSETVNQAIAGVYGNIGDVSKAKGGLEGLTSKALALSETFDQEVGPTTAAVGQMLKTGLAKNADEAFDILTAGLQSGANKADDLLDTVNEYGTQWRKFGLDGKTAMGLLSQGLKAGARDGDLVADSIKEFSIRAIDGSTTTAQGFKALGLNAQDMAAKIGKGGKSATGALDETLDRLRGIKDPVKRSAVAVQLFGTQAEDLGDALYALDPSTAVQGLGKVGGAADKAMKTMSESPAKTLEKFKRTIMVKLADVAGTFIKFATDHKDVMVPLAATIAGIAAVVLTVRTGMMLWSTAQTIWAGATAIATGAQWLWNAALAASPMTWIILAIIAVIAVIVLIATKTTWFQTIWSTVWGAIQTAFSATVAWLSDAFSWFAELPGKFAGWFGKAKDWAIDKLMALVKWQYELPGRILKALANLGSSLAGRASSAFQSMKDSAVNKATSLINWVKGLPGRIGNAIGDLNNLLYNKGLDVVSGLWRGIQAMGSWLKGVLIGWAKDLIPGPIAKALGIGSPSKVMAAEIGHWIPPGIVQGAEDNRGVLDKAMQGLVRPELAAPQRPLTTGMAGLMGGYAGGQRSEQRIVFEFRGPRAFREFFQESVRVTAGGSVIKFAEG
ncbi:phage tail tape measure protein [Streptomyces sp. NPDC001984]